MLNKTYTWTAKSAPYPPCTVTAFWLKKTGRGRCLRRVTQPPHIAGPLAARQICSKSSLHKDFRRARKSFEALPCNRPFASKHMLFCLPRQRHLDNFSITWRIPPVYRDSAIWTTSSFNGNSWPFIRTMQPWKLHRNMTISTHRFVLFYRDNFIITWQSLIILSTIILPEPWQWFSD